jgi:hypothetical protein
MNARTTPSAQPTGPIIHPDFAHYVAVNQEGVKAFLKAIAVNAVGQAIALAAVAIRVKAMIMPNMSREARCKLLLPKGAWVNNPKWMQNVNKRQAQFLEVTCWQISGAVAEFSFDESDYYGNLGLGDIQGSYAYLSAYESAHDIRHDRVLGGCTVVVERLFSKYYEVAETMAAHLAAQGSLDELEIARYLSGVPKEELGKQVLAVFQEPWLEDEAERVQRMFIGS